MLLLERLPPALPPGFKSPLTESMAVKSPELITEYLPLEPTPFCCCFRNAGNAKAVTLMSSRALYIDNFSLHRSRDQGLGMADVPT